MASGLDYNQLDGLIADVLASNAKTERERTVGLVLEYLVGTQTIDVWAEALSNRFGYHDSVGRQDIRSVIVEKLLITLHAAQSGTTKRVKNWTNFLFGLSGNAVRDYLGSSQVTAASGMAGATRRRASVRVARRELVAELGREPSRQEIIDYTNAYMLANRKDPKKGGALVGAEDFTPADVAVGLDSAARVLGHRDGAEQIEQRAEASLAARSLMRRCAGLYPDDGLLVRAAEAWIGLTLAGERVTAVLLGSVLDCPRGLAKQCLNRIDEALAAMRAV